jgi:hypothetical protein
VLYIIIFVNLHITSNSFTVGKKLAQSQLVEQLN